MNSKKSRLKGMVKIVLFILAVLMIYNIFTSFQMANKDVQTYEITVGTNDTIWNMAEEICKKNNDLNVQNVMIEIKQANSLSSSDIFAGQVLNIPVY